MGRTIILFALLSGLMACGDPLRDVDRLSDVAVADEAANTVAPTPAETAPRQGGLFSRLLNRPAQDPTNAAVDAALADARTEGESADEEAATLVAAAPQSERDGRGVFGLFGRPRAPETQGGGDTSVVPAGTVLPFGQVARVCDLSRGNRGREVANVSGYRVYDTIPNSTAARPHYITGFDDSCARTFTAAVVIPSDVAGHEFVRYQALRDLPYNQVDNAYEALKASFCRVGRGRPCGSRTNQLSRNTHFLSIYRSFGGSNDSWAEILLHGGEVLAVDFKDS